MARMTQGGVVDFFQNHGARIHFNHFQIRTDEKSYMVDDKLNIRYGIIGLENLKRDLRLWETLMVSSIMQRPHDIIE